MKKNTIYKKIIRKGFCTGENVMNYIYIGEMTFLFLT
jgi:hypothetical protein